MDITTVLTTLLRDGFILVFNQDKLDIVKTAEALLAAGIGNMEVTCRIKKPLEKLARLRKELPAFVAGSASLIDWPGMLKVYNQAHADDPLPTLQQVVDAGACYLVSAVNFSDAGYKKFAGTDRDDPRLRQCDRGRDAVRQRGEPVQGLPGQGTGRSGVRRSHRPGPSQDDQPRPHGRDQRREHSRTTSTPASSSSAARSA